MSCLCFYSIALFELTPLQCVCTPRAISRRHYSGKNADTGYIFNLIHQALRYVKLNCIFEA